MKEFKIGQRVEGICVLSTRGEEGHDPIIGVIRSIREAEDTFDNCARYNIVGSNCEFYEHELKYIREAE